MLYCVGKSLSGVLIFQDPTLDLAKHMGDVTILVDYVGSESYEVLKRLWSIKDNKTKKQ